MSRRGFRLPLWIAVTVLVLLLVGIVLLVLTWLTVNPTAAPPTAPGAPPAAGPSPDWGVTFTEPLIPDDPSRHRGGLDARLVTLMDRATSTLDVAVYDFDLANVAQAMARAARRGVRVRMVTDSDTLENQDAQVQAAFETVRQASIPIVPDGRQPIMHDKFTVVDGEWLETGSWNYTDGDTYRLNNNQAIFHSRELAANYSAEFEKMFVQRKFGPNKPRGVPYPLVTLDGMQIRTYFAPQDRVASRIVEQINAAQHRIHFLAFSFTQDDIGKAMIAKHAAGLEVQGVFETTGSNTQFSELGAMKRAGLDVYQDGNPYVMHHKVILLDDQVTIFGSFNFSNNADRDNDENLLIVQDPQFTARFEQEFQRVLALAKSPPERTRR